MSLDFFREYLSERSLNYFEELNIFSEKSVRNVFFFFLIVTLFGYTSILLYHVPYCDDFARYACNYTCGTIEDGRPIPGLAERMIFLSNMVFDIAPLTQFISCSILAYTATIVMKICNAAEDRYFSPQNHFFLACFIPVAVNPYILEMIMFRFDNVFMVGSYFCSVLAAYMSRKNDKGCLIFQIILLFYSIATYQAAITAYFLIFAVLLLKEVTNGIPVGRALIQMKYWVISILATILLYFPIFLSIKRGSFDLANYCCYPRDGVHICAFFQRIISQINELRSDWFNTIAGMFLFIMVLNFIFSELFQIARNKHINHKTLSVFTFLTLCLCTLLALFGINAMVPQEYCSSFDHTNPRTLCSIGILISFLLFENLKILSKNFFGTILYKVFLFSFSIWNIAIINAFGNIFFTQHSLENSIFYSLGQDLDKIISSRREKETYLHFNGISLTPAFNNFLNEYPFFRKFSVSDWNFRQVSQAALQCPRLHELISSNKAENQILFYKYNSFKVPPQYKFSDRFEERKLLKNSSWYDIFLIDSKIIDIVFKSGNRAKTGYKQSIMTRIN